MTELTRPEITFFVIVVVAFALLITERLRNDVVGVLIVLALAVTGLLKPKEALAGFSSEPAKPLAPNLQSSAQSSAGQTILAASWPEKKSDRPDWPCLFPHDHVRLRDWFDKPQHHLRRS